jgi:hypothetical protein
VIAFFEKVDIEVAQENLGLRLPPDGGLFLAWHQL